MTSTLSDRSGAVGDEGRRRVRPPLRTEDPLARALGLAGLALAVVLLGAPKRALRLAGVRHTTGTRTAAQAVGARQLITGAGVLASRRPVGWLWARAAGDTMDLTLLALGAAVQARGHQHRPARALAPPGEGRLRSVVRSGVERRRRRPGVDGWSGVERRHRRRGPAGRRGAATAAALATTVAVAVADAVAAIRLTRRRGPHRTASATVTVNRPRDEVYRRWRELQDFPRFMTHLDLRPPAERRRAPPEPAPPGSSAEWDADVVQEVPGELIEWRSTIASDVDHAGTVRFAPDPGGRGTEVTVRVDYRPPGGLVGSLVAGLFGEHPRQQISDDLLRFKHLVESIDE